MKKKKIKLKKQVWILLGIIILLIIGINFGKKKYKEYKYKQTYEYKLLQKGYTIDEYKLLKNNFNEKELSGFLNKEKDDITLNLLKEKYFIKKNYSDYLNYYNSNKDFPLKKVVAAVNTNTNREYYENPKEANLNKDYLILVNKYYYLKDDYSPSDLVIISSKYAWGENGSKETRQITLNAYLNMYESAKNDGIDLMINSSYRTYENQQTVYKKYEDREGTIYADEIAARPGHSEHQTGLALDIFSKTNSNTKTFKDSEAYKWLLDNSYKYGFILRYPEDKEYLTGFSFESWHYRYVGIEAATYIYNNDITFDEYYAYFLDN